MTEVTFEDLRARIAELEQALAAEPARAIAAAGLPEHVTNHLESIRQEVEGAWKDRVDEANARADTYRDEREAARDAVDVERKRADSIHARLVTLNALYEERCAQSFQYKQAGEEWKARAEKAESKYVKASEEAGFQFAEASQLRERAEKAETALREADALWSSADNAGLIRDLRARAERAELHGRAAGVLLGEWLTGFETDSETLLPVRATKLFLGLPAAPPVVHPAEPAGEGLRALQEAHRQEWLQRTEPDDSEEPKP